MSEINLIQGDASHEIWGGHIAGQTFRPTYTHTIEYVDLDIRLGGTLSPPPLLIYPATPSHHPTADYISRNNYVVPPIPTTTFVRRVRYKMTPALLTMGEYYCIVVRPAYGLGFPTCRWSYKEAPSSYARGIKITSDDAGATWTDYFNEDFVFGEFGTPATPEPPPDPPIPIFMPTILEQIPTADGFKIIYHTNVPAHLWLRWTIEPPVKHIIPVMKRGVFLHKDIRQCFVAWCPVEQEEAGETLAHTFIMPGPTPGIPQRPDDWQFWEPWGTNLTQFNPWEKHGFLYGSNVSLGNGLMTMFNDAQLGVNISTITETPQINLLGSMGQDLSLHHYSPIVDYNPIYGWLSYIFVTKKMVIPAETFDIEPIVARGSFWGPFGGYEAVFDSVYAFDLGKGPAEINFTDKWIAGRILAGLNPDPTNWYVDEVFITNEQLLDPVAQTIENDVLGLFYSIPVGCNTAPWPICQTRYFYIGGKAAGLYAKSTSPIFWKHREATLLMGLLFLEPWSEEGAGPPVMVLKFLEPWSFYSSAPPMGQEFIEPWTA